MEEKNNTIEKPNKMDMKVKLSTLWIFVTLNYLYCDIFGLMDPILLKQFMTGNVNGIEMTEGLLLSFSILVEIPIAMVLLSRVLKYSANRWVNIIAASIKTVLMILTMFVGSSPTMYYMFFGTVEITTTSFIVWYAWKWTKEES